MKYELAKRLKDAGFPQNMKGGSVVFSTELKDLLGGYKRYIHLGGGHNGNEGLYAEHAFTCCLDEFNKEDSNTDINSFVLNLPDKDVILIPTLEELIGACPKMVDYREFDQARFSLSYHIDVWDGKGAWIAMLDTCDYSPRRGSSILESLEGSGATPWEAVANFWLILRQNGYANGFYDKRIECPCGESFDVRISCDEVFSHDDKTYVHFEFACPKCGQPYVENREFNQQIK